MRALVYLPPYLPDFNPIEQAFAKIKGLLRKAEARTRESLIDVVGPPPGGLFGETNDNSVALLLTHGTARVLLAGDAEAREEEYMAFGPYTGPLTSSTSRYYTHSDPRFRALLLTEGAS